jgi:hypothetical protein
MALARRVDPDLGSYHKDSSGQMIIVQERLCGAFKDCLANGQMVRPIINHVPVSAKLRRTAGANRHRRFNPEWYRLQRSDEHQPPDSVS